MKKICATILLLTGLFAARAENQFLPFPVTLDGQEAKAKDSNAIFAVVEKDVAADSEISLKVEPGMIIVNAFPCDEKGSPTPGTAPAIILGQNTTKVKLDQTMDKKPLQSGTRYVANIVAGGKTARVMFKIK